jgi:cell division transport system ATP-binding protein
MLSLKEVSKSFGKICALENISFDVDEGELLFITGPSGAGKTTLMRLILRELLPDTGQIFLGDQDITQLKNAKIPKYRQKIGVVFQDFKVMPERTLRENVEIALAVIGLARDQWKSRVDHVLGLVGLTERSNLFPSQLSGGELQRVSLARALVVNPKIVLADEPTGNLDWDTADKLMELFGKINKEGKTVIMATHHQLIVDKYANRVIKLGEGKLVDESKNAKEPRKRPKDKSKGEDKEEVKKSSKSKEGQV